MPGWSGKSKGGALGYRIFVALIRHTSIGITYFFIRIVALYYLVFSRKAPMRFYFREIHGYNRLKSFGSIYRNYCLLGEILVDKVALLSGAKTDYTFDFEGEEHLHAMSREGKGGVLVGAHMGNWEIAGQLLERIKTPVNIVMLEAEHERIKAILDEVMVNRSIRVILQKEDFSHLFQIDEAFKRNEFVVIHGDRFLPGTNTVTVPFLGREARFPSGPLYLASKKGVPVSFVYTLKEAATHYHFYATPGKLFPYPSKMKTRRVAIRKMVESYVSSLEIMVKKYPLQWFNYYQFWDTDTMEMSAN
jgi:predicted LPLAT superfamily acyltransferase